jgi:hypothetical protein
MSVHYLVGTHNPVINTFSRNQDSLNEVPRWNRPLAALYCCCSNSEQLFKQRAVVQTASSCSNSEQLLIIQPFSIH